MKQVILLGAAVHTRDKKPSQDYSWCVKAGDTQLFDKADEIYCVALRDVSGETPRLAVLIDKQRVGFLIADMPSPRFDHSNRVIYDTLYLEFDAEYQQSVLHAVAVLLLCSKNTYKSYEQHFTHYAEMFFQNVLKVRSTSIQLPVIDRQPDFNLKPIELEKLVLFSSQVNRNRCAHYIIDFVYHGDKNFYFVSTGRISLARCQQIAEQNDRCVLLTLSSEVQSELNLKKSQLSRFRRLFKLT